MSKAGCPPGLRPWSVAPIALSAGARAGVAAEAAACSVLLPEPALSRSVSASKAACAAIAPLDGRRDWACPSRPPPDDATSTFDIETVTSCYLR
eukprot:scaffold69619_cov99-Phaeocystis_antarctica.AAC.1